MDETYLLSTVPEVREELNLAQRAIARWDLRGAIRADAKARSLVAELSTRQQEEQQLPTERRGFLDDVRRAIGHFSEARRGDARETYYGSVAAAWPDGVQVAEPVRLNLDEDGERFMLCIRGAVEDLAAIGLASGLSLGPQHGRDNSVRAVVTVESFLFDGQLEIVSDGGLVYFRVRDQRGISDGERSQWALLVANALEDFYGGKRELSWRAVIGPTFQWLPGPVILRGHRYRIGPLTFGSAGFVIGQPADILDRTEFEFEPVIVTGLCEDAHDWGIDAEQEGIFVRRLCALLTLLSETVWTMKAAPTSLGSPVEPINEPMDFLARDLAGLGVEPSSEVPRRTSRHSRLSVPRWVSEAWSRVDKEPTLGMLLTAHHEAREMEYQHPSAALLIYIATLDKIGGLLGKQGSGERVRTAIRRGCPPAEADNLISAYKLRNRTSHEAMLHALEMSYGMEASSHLGAQSGTVPFRFFILRGIREASRRLVVAALREEI